MNLGLFENLLGVTGMFLLVLIALSINKPKKKELKK